MHEMAILEAIIFKTVWGHAPTPPQKLVPVTLVPMAWAHGSTYIIIVIQYESVVSYRSVYMYIVISLALWSPKFFQEKPSDMLAKQPLGHTVIMHGAYKLYYVTETLVAIKVPSQIWQLCSAQEKIPGDSIIVTHRAQSVVFYSTQDHPLFRL